MDIVSESNDASVRESPPKDGKRQLRKVAARGAAYSGIAQGLKVLLSMASVIVVARLLAPSEFGVIAMTTPITGFILIFQNLGLNQAVVQARTINEEQTNALFFYNLAASAAIALIFLAISPLVGLFYGDPRPAMVTAASALTVLLTGTTLQHTALLNRAMRFRALSFVDVTTAAAALLFTVGFALWLRNFWALWLGAFCGTIVNAALVWRIDRWRPSRRIVWGSARNMVKFGANLTGFNFLNFIRKNIDNILIAKMWGSSALGLYDRSYKLMMFPLEKVNSPLARVMLPALARVQDEPARYRRMFLLAIQTLSIVSVPGIMAVAMCSDVVIPLLFGARWTDASPIFFWLSLAAVTQPVSNATGWLFISSGRTREMFQWGLYSTPVTIAAFVIGLPWGPVGVAKAYFLSQAVTVPVLYYWCTRGTAVSARDLYAAILPTLVGGLLAWSLVLLAREHLSTVPLLATAFVCSYGFSVAVQAVTKKGRTALVEMTRILSAARP
ncbi:lipopolysaccharide biosynthesis protein [Novosphingobium sp. KN65.2]|uniref:lipopolysaccharide biosynthesis protein n=1 Tax=Novosphingobium sp. KN65.2 TaxID=1478134 RepID=UPI0005DAA58B|nr:lipopolysaccharide biosynthesis protein [Novosphingobium sp. KN65.2]CDO34531.1 Polysaccharide biosynthesis protein [Novosphingobium sp. KN65.2]